MRGTRARRHVCAGKLATNIVLVHAVGVYCLVSGVRAAPASSNRDTAILSAMRLSEQTSYTWISSVEDDARAYTVHGKTGRDQYTCVTLPMVDTIAERLGRNAGTHLEVIFKGPARAVIRVGDDWKTVDELPRERRREDAYGGVRPRAGHLLGNLPASNPHLGPVAVIGWPSQGSQPRAFSNARLAFNHPHEELALIVSSCNALEFDADTVSGELSDIGARLLLAPNDDPQATPLLAAGRFKFWITDRLVSRYQLRLEGVMLVGNKRIVVRQSSDTTVRDIGRTVLAVPDGARLKLGQ